MGTDSDGARRDVEVRELVGVYHAKGTVLGELTYWVAARLGRGHCQLCDITHGSIREKPEWRSCRDAMAVPFRTVHLDERSPAVAQATEGRTPCVVAVTDDGVHLLLGPEELARCEGSPVRLVEAVEAAMDRQMLR